MHLAKFATLDETQVLHMVTHFKQSALVCIHTAQDTRQVHAGLFVRL